MFVKIKSSSDCVALYKDCVVEAEPVSDDLIEFMDAKTGEVHTIQALFTDPAEPMTTEELLAQPCYAEDVGDLEVGNWVKNEHDVVYKIENFDGIVAALTDTSWGRTFMKRCDKLTKLDPDDAVASDYVTGDPIFEENEDECITIYGFSRNGHVTELGLILGMNFDESRFMRCDDCDRYFDSESSNFDLYFYTDDDNTCVCEECYEDNEWTRCERCDRLIHMDDAYENDGNWYCENCYDLEREENKGMHEYSFKPYPIFHNYDKKKDEFYAGVELEIDKGNDVDDCVSQLYEVCDNENLFYMKHDGSLDDGIEIVTHPCDLEYHLKDFPWEDICDIAKENGFKSHDAGTCGLHVHISRKAFGDNEDLQDLNIAKIIILVDRFWDELVNFSRRNYNQLERWAKKPNAKIYSYDTESTAITKAKNASAYDRYKAINLTNRNTVEFRMFRGTLELNTIKATLEFLSNLVGYVKASPLAAVQETKWQDITKFTEYDELNAYLEKRNLVDVPDKPKPEEPKPIEVRFHEGDVVWFSTENTDNEPMRGTVSSVDVDTEVTLQPLYVVVDSRDYVNFLIDSEIFSNNEIAQREEEYNAAMPV